MKVIQFVPTLDSGGVEQGVMEMSKALVANQHESHVVSAGGRLVNQLIQSGAQHHKWDLHKKNFFTFRLVKPLRKWIISMSPDIVHVRSRMPAWIVWQALKGIPFDKKPSLVSTIHGLYSVNFYSAIMSKPQNIITVSKSSHKYLVENYSKSLNKNIKLIYRGIDSNEYYQGYKPNQDWLKNWYSNYPDTKNVKLLTIAGRISPLKDFEKIISLAKSINNNSHHKIKVLIAGEAKDKHQKYLNMLKEKIKFFELENDIHFLNFREDIKEIYSISSIVFNASSRPESFGRSILEPLSIGIPCIGYGRGGVKEILEILFPFGLVKPNDDQAMLEKTLAILDGNNIKIKENREFLTSTMCEQTIDFYKEISS